MAFLIFRPEDRKWGSERSYTRDLMKARVYQSREAAEQDCCGNERIVSTDELR